MMYTLFCYFQSLMSKCHVHNKLLQPTIENLELPIQRTKDLKNCSSIERPYISRAFNTKQARLSLVTLLAEDYFQDNFHKYIPQHVWLFLPNYPILQLQVLKKSRSAQRNKPNG